VPDRRLFNDRFARRIARARLQGTPLALLFIDLDDFKLVNDRLGHAAGDALLEQVARRLQAAVRSGDIVARIAADEFAIMLAGDPAVVAQNILERVGQPVILGGEQALVTASIGIAAFPGDGDSAEALLSAADAAMYQAKQSGRNAYRFYTPEISSAANSSLSTSRSTTSKAARRAAPRRCCAGFIPRAASWRPPSSFRCSRTRG
jgi:diguanylate cyclase (GGDEF)-like protein